MSDRRLRASWRRLAVCLAHPDPDLWFSNELDAVAEAKAICAVCPVRVKCLDDALTHREAFGTWGGLSEKERARLLKRGA